MDLSRAGFRLIHAICAKLPFRQQKWRRTALRNGIPAIKPRRTGAATSAFTKYLLSPTNAVPNDDGYFITRLMYYIWKARPDLNRIFNLHDKTSRLEYCRWLLLWGSREYGLPADAYPDELLTKLAESRGVAGYVARLVLVEKQKGGAPDAAAGDDRTSTYPQPQSCSEGINLIGQFRGQLGLGELSRAAVRACRAAAIPYSIVDCQITGVHGAEDHSIEGWTGDSTAPNHRINILSFTPISLPPLYFAIGENFFSRHYNIGYWPWELAKCPPEFELAFRMVDEVWAISTFTSESLRTYASVPIVTMPPAVSIPAFSCRYSKAYFGLEEGTFHFIFVFDAASSLVRKNPLGVALAFKTAFPRNREKVRLVLKVMNASAREPAWEELLAVARDDRRIMIVDKRLSREETLGLTSVCDAFVSLHRSEGFGFGMAEAMLLGKPVVATNYSGSLDFAHEGTACVVNYTLTSVPAGSYPFWHGQVWAEPVIEHAALLMQQLVENDSYREKIAKIGQRFVCDNFNERTIGARYAARLNELKSP